MSNPIDRLKTALADRYAIERELGAGGHGDGLPRRGFEAQPPRGGQGIAPRTRGRTRVRAVRARVEIAAQLEHPHILTLIDSGEADGFLFYVMPYIKGESLRERLAHGELPIDEAVRILRDVADALVHAPARDGEERRWVLYAVSGRGRR